MKTFVIFLFSFTLLQISEIIPQYSRRDKDLVETTFTKKFNKNIIHKYLFSSNEKKVNAALLSIAQSEDTSWINDIFKLNFLKYHKEICFALGELGSCDQSTKYLLTNIEDHNKDENISHEVLEAVGRTGNKNSYEIITRNYIDQKRKSYDGISIALYNYFIRGILNKGINEKILKDELSYFNSNAKRFYEAAFALYRIDDNGTFRNQSSAILLKNLDSSIRGNEYIEAGNFYLLSYLKKIKYFPEDYNLFQKTISAPEFSIRIAAAQSLCFYNYRSQNDLNDYLKLLDDKNPNISREAAISIHDISVDNDLKNYLRKILFKKILTGSLPENTKGELFISYLKLFPEAFDNMLKDFDNKISKDFLYRSCARYDSSEAAFNYLVNSFPKANESDKITVLTSLLEFQKRFGENPELKKIIFNSLKSNSPALISIAADGLDSNFVTQNESMLRTIIFKTCSKFLNNCDYVESLMSLSGLAGKINPVFEKRILNIIVNSSDYSIKMFGFNELKLPTRGIIKSKNNFDDLWNKSFKYSKAEIATNKGKFTIKFLPQYAPITAGNFCYLAEKKILFNNKFHRVVPGFVIQGGDPEETGWGGPGYEINSEFSPLEYSAGMVGMASAGKDTEGSQWFVTTGFYPHLNGRYTIFAEVIEGTNVVKIIDQNDKVLTITLF